MRSGYIVKTAIHAGENLNANIIEYILDFDRCCSVIKQYKCQ